MRCNRATFATDELLDDFVSSADVIVHLAGMNRGDYQELERTNMVLAGKLISSCERADRRPHIVFSSSTHIHRNSVYGNSKRVCTELFEKWARAHGAAFTNLILPNIFGECGKPFENSAVSTFCYQLANGQKPEIIKDILLDLLHAQSLAREIYDIIRSSRRGDIILAGTPITVSDLLSKLIFMYEKYHDNIIPDLRSEFELNLFNTYRSYLYPAQYPIKVKLNSDNRGLLFEAIKSLNMGQTFVSTTVPGVTRGNHYHMKKIERFFVLSGSAEIKIRKLFFAGIDRFEVCGKTPQYIDIPTLHTHSITNTGDGELITLLWSNEFFEAGMPDTISETV